VPTSSFTQPCEIAGNRALMRAISGLRDSAQRFSQDNLAYPGRLAQSVVEHSWLLEAIRARDAEKAERLAIEYVRRTRSIRIALTLAHDDLLTNTARDSGLP
jgi:DNA-binding FadR family transcriptional regulator